MTQRIRRFAATARVRRLAFLNAGVTVDRRSQLGRGCRVMVDRHATLILGTGCEIDDGTTLAVYGRGKLVLGPGSFVGHHCTIAARELVTVGEGTFLAELVSVRDHDHLVGEPPSSGRVRCAAVHIGEHVWLGAKVTVLAGARVGDGAVVGANAVVRGEIAPRVVAAGMPAKAVRIIQIDAQE